MAIPKQIAATEHLASTAPDESIPNCAKFLVKKPIKPQQNPAPKTDKTYLFNVITLLWYNK